MCGYAPVFIQCQLKIGSLICIWYDYPIEDFDQFLSYSYWPSLMELLQDIRLQNCNHEDTHIAFTQWWQRDHHLQGYFRKKNRIKGTLSIATLMFPFWFYQLTHRKGTTIMGHIFTNFWLIKSIQNSVCTNMSKSWIFIGLFQYLLAISLRI